MDGPSFEDNSATWSRMAIMRDLSSGESSRGVSCRMSSGKRITKRTFPGGMSSGSSSWLLPPGSIRPFVSMAFIMIIPLTKEDPRIKIKGSRKKMKSNKPARSKGSWIILPYWWCLQQEIERACNVWIPDPLQQCLSRPRYSHCLFREITFVPLVCVNRGYPLKGPGQTWTIDSAAKPLAPKICYEKYH